MQLCKMRLGAVTRWVLVCLFSAASVHAQYKAVTVTDGGTITGTVKFIGTPTIDKLEVSKDQRICGTSKISPRLAVGKNGGIQNAVVMLVGLKEGKPSTSQAKASIDQKGCEYSPHVQVVLTGTQLEVSNSDPLLHNVHAYNPEDRTLFNIAQPIKGQRTSSKRMRFQKPGVYSFSCDAGHIWMSAFVVAVEHPYFAVTDANGNFRIEDVPPGTYRIKMWHEGFSIVKKDMRGSKVTKYHYEEPYEATKEVSVESESLVAVNFELKPREH